MKLRNVLTAASLSLFLSSVPAQAQAFEIQSFLNWFDCGVIFSTEDSGDGKPDPEAENDND